ncbi:MAG: hypothetical protein ACT4QE_24000 [Anaerolineales bacterium]
MSILAIAIPIAFVVGLFVMFSFIGWVEVDDPGLVRGMAPTRRQRPPTRATVRPSVSASDFAQPAVQ